jgi:hypothetical protein
MAIYNFLKLEGNLNCIKGLKVTAILWERGGFGIVLEMCQEWSVPPAKFL